MVTKFSLQMHLTWVHRLTVIPLWPTFQCSR